jgi:hypothetical protein
MTRFRAFIVAGAIGVPIALSLTSLMLDRVLWPFSPYPMYSRLAGPTAAVTRAVGVAGDEGEVPLPSRIEPTGIRLQAFVDRMRSVPDASVRLARIATAMATEYERLRAAGEVEGPKVTAVRIYLDTIGLATRPHIRNSVLVAQGAPR